MENDKNAIILDSIKTPPEEIQKGIEVITCAKGTQLLKSGSPIQYVHIIVEGSVIVFEETITGDAGRVVKLYPGELVGEMETLAEQTASVYSAIVSTNGTRLLQLRPKLFVKWLQMDIVFCNVVIKILAKKMFNTAALLGTYTLDSSLSILCNYFYEVTAETFATKSKCTIYQTRKEIAENCRLSVRTVNRRILELKMQGLIEINKGKIVIRKDQMEKILELIKND